MRHKRLSRALGFTLIELLTVLALFAIATIFLFPAMNSLINRSKIRGTAEQVTGMVRLARLQAIKTFAPSVVKVQTVSTAEGNAREVFAFSDRNNNDTWDPPDATNLNDGPKLSSLFLPTGVLIAGTGTAVDANSNAFVGTFKNGPGTIGFIRFQPSGSADLATTATTSGAFRFRDNLGNVLEIRINPAATGRVAIRKYEGPDPSDATDDATLYYLQGQVPTLPGPPIDSDHQWNWKQ